MFNPYQLTAVRHSEGLTTAELAFKMGKRETDIRLWEQGVEVPQLADLVQLEWVTGWPLDRFRTPGRDRIEWQFTTLDFHFPREESEVCVECDSTAEFLCDQRGHDGSYNCSLPLCVIHAVAAHGGDYCGTHLNVHQPA